MSDALAVLVADAVVAELNAGTFSESVSAVRSFLPEYDLKDLKDLRVTVLPAGDDLSSESRGANRRLVRVEIGIQKRLPTGEEAEAEEMQALLLLLEEIKAYLAGRTLGGQPAARWLATENSPIYDPETVQEHRSFLSVLRVSYLAIQ